MCSHFHGRREGFPPNEVSHPSGSSSPREWRAWHVRGSCDQGWRPRPECWAWFRLRGSPLPCLLLLLLLDQAYRPTGYSWRVWSAEGGGNHYEVTMHVQHIDQSVYTCTVHSIPPRLTDLRLVPGGSLLGSRGSVLLDRGLLVPAPTLTTTSSSLLLLFLLRDPLPNLMLQTAKTETRLQFSRYTCIYIYMYIALRDVGRECTVHVYTDWSMHFLHTLPLHTHLFSLQLVLHHDVLVCPLPLVRGLASCTEGREGGRGQNTHTQDQVHVYR